MISPEIKEKRLAKQKEIEEAVRFRVAEPWPQRAHDLILYR